MYFQLRAENVVYKRKWSRSLNKGLITTFFSIFFSPLLLIELKQWPRWGEPRGEWRGKGSPKPFDPSVKKLQLRKLFRAKSSSPIKSNTQPSPRHFHHPLFSGSLVSFIVPNWRRDRAFNLLRDPREPTSSLIKTTPTLFEQNILIDNQRTKGCYRVESTIIGEA